MFIFQRVSAKFLTTILNNFLVRYEYIASHKCKCHLKWYSRYKSFCIIPETRCGTPWSNRGLALRSIRRDNNIKIRKGLLCPSYGHWYAKHVENKLLQIIGSWINVVKWSMSRAYCRPLRETGAQSLALLPCLRPVNYFLKGLSWENHTSPPCNLVNRSPHENKVFYSKPTPPRLPLKYQLLDNKLIFNFKIKFLKLVAHLP